MDQILLRKNRQKHTSLEDHVAMSDTPRTDANQKAMEREDFDVELALTYDFARTLERENSAMREAIKEAHRVLENARFVHQAITTYVEQTSFERQENQKHCDQTPALPYHMTTIPYSHNGEIIQLVPLEEYEQLQHELTTAQADAIYWQQRFTVFLDLVRETHSELKEIGRRYDSEEMLAYPIAKLEEGII